tara:strand:- start:120 stop:809 length:690 start_codon:yes stop_codon:yes gene_type:complete
MLDRYSLIKVESISDFLLNDKNNITPIYNASPTFELPIIDFNLKKITMTLWGSTSYLSKNKSLAKRLVNLEVSKIKKSNILLNQFKYNRCLIPCDGFFFWKKINQKEKIPYYFSFQKDKIMYCIGIKEKYENLTGDSFYYFSFITSISDIQWRKFTTQIPIIFDSRYLDIWFNRSSSFDKISSFINPLRFEDFNNFSISPYFEKMSIDDMRVVEPKNNLNQYGNYSLFD